MKPINYYPIGFWNYPNIKETPVSEAARWKNCGMTLTQTPFFSYEKNDPTAMTAMLDAMAEAGVDAFVCISDLDFHRFVGHPEGYRDIFARAYADFGKHPAVRGFFVGDEPLNDAEFAACQEAYRVMREVAPELTPLLNFNPYWHGMEYDLLNGEDFDGWIDRFIRSSGCPLICYDCYWQMNPGEEGINMYFTNLNRYVSAAKRNGIQVFNTVLSCGHFRYRVPTEDDLRWQLSTSVASGCNGILWFLYYGQHNCNNYRGSPVDELGEESATYTSLRRVQLLFHRRYGAMMAKLHFDRAWHFPRTYGNYPMYTTGALPHIRKMTSDNDLPGMLSRFTDDDGQEYLVLVNNSQTESGLFTFHMDGGVKQFTRYWNGEAVDFIVSHHDAVYGDDGHVARAGFWLAPGQMEVLQIGY